MLNVKIPAGTIRSDVSQEDANSRALSFAQSQLECLYCNLAVPPLCTDPTGSLDLTTGIPANSYCASDAAAAQALANQQGAIPVKVQTDGTACLYGNAAITVTCDTLLGPGSNASVSPNARQISTVAANTVQFTVKDVPPDFAGTPGDYANSVARTLALSLLDCFFQNDPLTLTCDDLGLPNVYKASVSSVTIAAGTFTSYTSKAEAQAQAHIQATLNLNCFYANASSRYLCADGANTGTYNPNFVKDVDIKVFGDGHMAEIGTFAGGRYPVADGSRGSAARPLVVPEAMFTSMKSQAEADALALNFAISTLDCYFENQQISVLCGASTANVLAPDQGNIGNPTSPLLYGDGKLQGTLVASRALGSNTHPVVIAAGTFNSTESRGGANIQALLVGISQLTCFVDNEAQTVMCPLGTGVAGIILQNFHPSAVYVVTVAAGALQSYQSLDDANAQALTEAHNELLCVYTNGLTKAGTCPSGTYMITNGQLQANTITSMLSQADAQQNAQLLTTAMTNCFNPTEAAGGGGGGGGSPNNPNNGPPGNDGAQTNCSGKCYGFYS